MNSEIKTALEGVSTDNISALLHNFAFFKYITESQDVFVEIFGSDSAEHLWRKWASHGDVVKFISYLDIDNTRKLSRFLVKRTSDQIRERVAHG